MPDIRKPAPAAVEPLLHRAARIENSVHRFREKRARKRGLRPTIVPYTGYGSSGWVRVLSRVLLTTSARVHVAEGMLAVPPDAAVVVGPELRR